MTVAEHVDALRSKHAQLKQAVADENQRPHPDEIRLAELKRQKLRLKDEIAKLFRSLSENPDRTHLVGAYSLGKAQRIDSALVRYEKFCASTLPDGLDLNALKVVFDGANGAG